MSIKLIECPRDAMQGVSKMIDTDLKVEYINQLLQVGFDTLDFGSFVSPRVIPQLADTHKVVDRLDLDTTKTKLLAIVANLRGAEQAEEFDQINYLGFPFSISEKFQQRNTNSSILESLDRVARIQEVCLRSDKKLVAYLSMGFGNPYGEEWNHDIVMNWVDKLVEIGVETIALSDTIGVSNPDNISYLFKHLIPEYPTVEFGAHLHSTPDSWEEKVEAAINSGCERFDGALRGYGGCPMADDDLVGNMAMENIISYCDNNGLTLDLNREALQSSLTLSTKVFL